MLVMSNCFCPFVYIYKVKNPQSRIRQSFFGWFLYNISSFFVHKIIFFLSMYLPTFLSIYIFRAWKLCTCMELCASLFSVLFCVILHPPHGPDVGLELTYSKYSQVTNYVHIFFK